MSVCVVTSGSQTANSSEKCFGVCFGSCTFCHPGSDVCTRRFVDLTHPQPEMLNSWKTKTKVRHLLNPPVCGDSVFKYFYVLYPHKQATPARQILRMLCKCKCSETLMTDGAAKWYHGPPGGPLTHILVLILNSSLFAHANVVFCLDPAVPFKHSHQRRNLTLGRGWCAVESGVARSHLCSLQSVCSQAKWLTGYSFIGFILV